MSAGGLGAFLADLYVLLQQRRRDLPEGSYSAKLFAEGEDAVLKKIAEEAGEVLIAAKGSSHDEIVWESSDLLFHLIVLWVEKGVTLEEIEAELVRRHGAPD